jgi:hypothetical protein
VPRGADEWGWRRGRDLAAVRASENGRSPSVRRWCSLLCAFVTVGGESIALVRSSSRKLVRLLSWAPPRGCSVISRLLLSRVRFRPSVDRGRLLSLRFTTAREFGRPDCRSDFAPSSQSDWTSLTGVAPLARSQPSNHSLYIQITGALAVSVK